MDDNLKSKISELGLIESSKSLMASKRRVYVIFVLFGSKAYMIGRCWLLIMTCTV